MDQVYPDLWLLLVRTAVFSLSSPMGSQASASNVFSPTVVVVAAPFRQAHRAGLPG